MKARDFGKCRVCGVLMTWPHQKKIFRKLMKDGMSYEDVKKVMPLCPNHLIYAAIEECSTPNRIVYKQFPIGSTRI